MKFLESIAKIRSDNSVKLKGKRICFGSLGNNVRFGGASIFNRAENMFVGDNVFFGAECYFEAVSDIIIGSGCMFGPRVFCIAGTHNYDCNDLRAIPYDNRQIDQPIVIEDNVWIAGNVSIAPGAHIGEGAVIGMSAIVAGNIPPYSIVVNQKGVVIKKRNIERYEKLKQAGKIYNDIFAGKPFEMADKNSL